MAYHGDVLPEIVVHADWSVDPRKRWVCRATLNHDRTYQIVKPAPAGDLDVFFRHLVVAAGEAGRILAGFDFPLGLPAAYADQVGIDDFRKALVEFGHGVWREFYEVAATAQEVSLFRPFFPLRPGGKGAYARSQLAAGLGVHHFDDLQRQVDRPTSCRPAASVMFWTLGSKQVGKAAIVGWRDLLAPALAATDIGLAMWPFDGTLQECMAAERITVAEAYPAEYYRHLDLPLVRGGSKRRQQSRIASGGRLIEWAAVAGVRLDDALQCALREGFGVRPDGEDPFDAVVGTCGILNVVLGLRPPFDPDKRSIRKVEGWTLGQAPPGHEEGNTSPRDQYFDRPGAVSKGPVD